MSSQVVDTKPAESLCLYCKHLTGDWAHCDAHIQETSEGKNQAGMTILLTLACTGYEKNPKAARQGASEGKQ